MKKYILASTSPRRNEILKTTGKNFAIAVPSYHENILNKTFSYKLIEETAMNKGLSVAEKSEKNTVIVSADTVVILDNLILGKPKDYDDAKRILIMLSGKTHKVVTSVCVINNENGKKFIKSETSEVTFNELTEEMIHNYITLFKPYDKAGAYGIQELDKSFIKEIKGCYYNIVGLPLNLTLKLLKEAEK